MLYALSILNIVAQVKIQKNLLTMRYHLILKRPSIALAYYVQNPLLSLYYCFNIKYICQYVYDRSVYTKRRLVNQMWRITDSNR